MPGLAGIVIQLLQMLFAAALCQQQHQSTADELRTANLFTEDRMHADPVAKANPKSVQLPLCPPEY